MRLQGVNRSKSLKLCLVGGARPNFMKIAPLVRAIHQRNAKNTMNAINYKLVHTGQHYDYEMSNIFFRDLGIPKPDVFLNVGSGNHGEQTGKIMMAFEEVLSGRQVDIVVVVGDVNSTIACALVAAKLHVPVAHVEAGLRSFDRTMPEEINRVLTDQISDYLFTPSSDANGNLKREGISPEKIYLVGNIMIDNLFFNLKKAQKSKIFKNLALITDGPNPFIRDYMLVTLHRPTNVDRKESLKEIIEALKEISKGFPIIFPMHPRTWKMVTEFNLEKYFNFHIDELKVPLKLSNSIYAIDPLGYIDFLALMSKAKLVLTDSGGIQEETMVLGIPCLTLRDTTERPITVTEGTNILVHNNKKKIVEGARKILKEPKRQAKYPKLWDGKTAERIVNILAKCERLNVKSENKE
jgi:UDP-N-acetylglucosamine 2-epimerase (non-hydrolysing)